MVSLHRSGATSCRLYSRSGGLNKLFSRRFPSTSSSQRRSTGLSVRVMAILKIARMGHSVLVDPAVSIEDPTAERVQRLVGHMKETMADAHGIGLAAPQVYQSFGSSCFSIPSIAKTRRIASRSC